MRLSGKQVGQIQSALLDAFSSKDALRMMVRLELDAQLDEIAGGDNLRVVVFNLVNWADQTGRESSLIQGAYRQNEGNQKLQQLVKEAQTWFIPEASAPGGGPAYNAGPAGPPVSIDIFLSYSRKDSDAMRRVQDDLRLAGYAVWIDEGLEAGTQSWRAAIEEVISQAVAMVVLLSPNSKASPWVNNEVAYAQTLGKRIFPVVVSGDATSAVPINLINAQWVDGRENLRQAVAQSLIPALHRHLLPAEPLTPTPVAAVKDGAVVPLAPRSSDTPSKKVNTSEDTQRTRRYFWVAVTLGVLIIGGLGYYFIEHLPQPSANSSSAETPTSASAAPKVSSSVSAARPTPRPTGASAFVATPEAGATRTNKKDGADYVYIPPGTFAMGSGYNDGLAFDDERPQHDVSLDGFWIMRTEVTNEQYKRCVDANECTPPHNDTWNGAGTAFEPVIDVDWHQAGVYAHWAGGRLPREAEWEHACRDQDGRIYSWGNETPEPDRLRYYHDFQGSPTNVGSYAPGANGLYDMNGNVWEWTTDWYDENYYATSPERNPTGPRDGAIRTVRGGSFENNEYHVRCAVRARFSPDFQGTIVGFRVVTP